MKHWEVRLAIEVHWTARVQAETVEEARQLAKDRAGDGAFVNEGETIDVTVLDDWEDHEND